MEHFPVQIAYDAGRENNEGFYQRIIAQMSAGEGPDLLFVHAEDMERLNGKQFLADLSGVLEEETQPARNARPPASFVLPTALLPPKGSRFLSASCPPW